MSEHPSKPDARNQRRPAVRTATDAQRAGIAPRSGKRSAGAARVIAASVARMIERGELTPGAPIREEELARRFGLSRSPIREALRLLERRCLVQIEPRKGARVAQFSDEEIIDVTLLRGVAFALAARRAASAASAEELAAIAAGAAALVAKVEAGNDPVGHTRDTLRLANLILSASHSRRIIEAVLNYAHGAPAMFAPLAYVTPAARKRSAQLYVRLTEALSARNAATAERLARQLTDEAIEVALKELTSRRIAHGGRMRLFGVADFWGLDAPDTAEQ